MRPDLEAFVGQWRLSRVIADRLTRETLSFEGTAEFSLHHTGLEYHEAGQLLRPGQPPMTATRRYFWQADGAGIDVAFDDGRPFHRIAPEARSAARHDCPPDLYLVRYDFTTFPDWSNIWQVSGPRKAYEMTSHYCRDAG